VTLAMARTKNYMSGKVGVFSTPTLEGASPIWQLWEEGTRGKWAWTCRHCAQWFVPRVELLIWPEGATPEVAEASARVVCPTCGAEHDSTDREAMNRDGRYLWHVLDDNGEEVPQLEAPANSTASFWVSGLASPWQSFGQIANVLVKAYRSKESERIQAAINTYAGELFRTAGEAPDWSEVAARRMPYARLSVPWGVQMITAGVDVQKRGLYFVVRGWGFHSESWLLDHGFIPGETEYDNVWILLSRVSNQQIGDRRIQRVFVDSGYRPDDRHQRPEHAVYAFCRRHPGLAYPSKGQASQDAPVKASLIETSPSGRMKTTTQLWHLDTDYLKSWIHGRIRWPVGEPGGWHLHQDTDEDYCRQLVSEQLLVKASGRRVWIVRSRDNHYLDAEANALAAALTLQVQSLPELREQNFNISTSKAAKPAGRFERPGSGFY
jgi:phage terminase large subunit GpA-like protein